MSFSDKLENIDGKTISIALSTAVSLIRAGTELIDSLSKDKSEEELLLLIAQYRKGGKAALDELDKSIENRKNEF